MTVNMEKIEENKIKLTVTVPAEQFNKALDYAFDKVSKDVELPGFRKGKVPRSMYIKKFGEGSLYEEAVNYIIPIQYPLAIDEAKINPVVQPQIDFDFENIGKDKDFVFYATVIVKPEVQLGNYKGLEVTELSTEVADADVNTEITKLLDRHVELVVKEEAAVDGDTVVIDYEGFKDDVAFEGGKGENYSLVLGSNSFIPGFEEQLIGIKVGEATDVNVTFPEEYHSEDLAGATVVFKVLCHEVKAKVLPELTDEFVKELELPNIETVEALKSDAYEKLASQKIDNAKNHLIDTLVEQAATNATINIPQEMIDAEAERLVKDAEQRLSQQGMTLELYLQYTGGNLEALQEQMKVEAVKRIRFNLTLEAIADAEQVEATEEEVNMQLENIAKTYNVTVEQVKAAFPNTDEIKGEVKVRKAIDLLIELANKTTSK